MVEEFADVGSVEVVEELLPASGEGDGLVVVAADEQWGAEVGFEALDLQGEILGVVAERCGGGVDAVVRASSRRLSYATRPPVVADQYQPE
ncbi:hypothetical protein KRMM14A1259_46750 [Krasilnikovia sp. MM14-A1259]